MKSVYVREEVCMGCGLCRVHCQTAHSRSKDFIKAFKKERPRPLQHIRIERKVEVSFPVQCRHCTEPWCVYSCLTGALRKDPVTGVVGVDSDKCMGCWTCVLACPTGALSRDRDEGYIVKCDLCPGQETPVCGQLSQ